MLDFPRMTNLDRLKGTPYLIDGFESFLKHWLTPQEPTQATLGWDDEEMELFEALPEAARQFYEVVQRWPGAQIEDGDQDWLSFPPRRVEEKRDPKLRLPVSAERLQRLLLAQDNDQQWTVELSLHKKDYGRLYTDYRDEAFCADTIEGFPMEVPVDEFLVMFGFYNMIITGASDTSEQSRFENAELIFFGRYQEDVEYGVFYHPGGYLWLGYGETVEDGALYCAKHPGLESML